MDMILIFVLWFLISIALLVMIHRYMWIRWVRDLNLNRIYRQIAAFFLTAMTVVMPLVMISARFLPPAIERLLAYLIYTWMGIIFYFLITMGIVDLVRFLYARRKVARAASAINSERRIFLKRSIAGGVGLSTAGLSAVGYAGARQGPVIERVEIPIAALPAAFDGLKIALISDLHVGLTIDRSYVEQVVALTISMNPDLIAVTGDMVDGSVQRLAEAVEPLAALKSRFGTFFVTGNHEYYSGADEWIAKFRDLGMRTLGNEHHLLEHDGGQLYIAGIHDYSAGRFGHSSDVDQALAGTEADIPVILLAHQPRSILNAARPQICLQLSGHTHGGQIWPFNYLVHLVQPYVAGLYQHDEQTKIYVNRGTGYWGPPMRFPKPSEISELILTRKA